MLRREKVREGEVGIIVGRRRGRSGCFHRRFDGLFFRFGRFAFRFGGSLAIAHLGGFVHIRFDVGKGTSCDRISTPVSHQFFLALFFVRMKIVR